MGKQDVQTEVEFLRLAASRFEQLFQGLPIACMGFDLGGTVFEWNRACELTFKFDDANLLMNSVYSVLCQNQAQRSKLADMLESVAAGDSCEGFEWTVDLGETSRHYLCSILPKPGPNGTVLGAMFAAVDMTRQKEYELQIEEQLLQINQYSAEIEMQRAELELANRRLESLAATDGLTGLANHRAFYDALERAVATSERNGQPVSVVLLDVDDFKSFNDTFGHPAGDDVLRQVASALTGASRRSDVVARYGGEEFAVIVQADAAQSAIVAERMRSAIEQAHWTMRRVTASFGVATGIGGFVSAETLVQQADQALYASKREGKNRVSQATSHVSRAA